jgi:3-phenylpropionate/trans-cinnamate dioxygenase ferredoxin subunit
VDILDITILKPAYCEIKMNEEKLVEVAKVQGIPAGNMKHIEIDRKEIAIANIEGKYYAFDDRCDHTGARLSMGAINGNIVTCPLHGAQFDCTTGKKVKEANSTVPPTEGLPDVWKKNVEYVYNILSYIKTYYQKRYDVTTDGDRIKISILD